MIPDPLRGAWRRVSIALDGGEEHETCDVLWLQARRSFVDLRVRRATGAVDACFAGTAAWSPPHLTWTHELDISGGEGDRGEMSWDGEDLIERGVAQFRGTTGPVPYVERWRRLPDDRPVRAFRSARGTRVDAGRHSLAVARTGAVLTATYRLRGPSGWRVERSVAAPSAVS